MLKCYQQKVNEKMAFLPAGTLSPVIKIEFFAKILVKILFCKHYFQSTQHLYEGRIQSRIRSWIQIPNTASKTKKVLLPFTETTWQ